VHIEVDVSECSTPGIAFVKLRGRGEVHAQLWQTRARYYHAKPTFLFSPALTIVSGLVKLYKGHKHSEEPGKLRRLKS
jgi:hypothetical protein